MPILLSKRRKSSVQLTPDVIQVSSHSFMIRQKKNIVSSEGEKKQSWRTTFPIMVMFIMMMMMMWLLEDEWMRGMEELKNNQKDEFL